ncbi:sulfite exporter TauE/SafE family protein [Nocardioides sp. W7]|uniref:sulfite exporter TauE/SafE family protein n=1 Tax=Nocardioides sp. W7 TaxID=2931390 RepID=UPI001FD38116|nr:sulfite exporter TauE/SafE family protein [Nocardioides sp. W7]
MPPFFEAVTILLAGVAAGGINAVVGSGTLITFPILLAFGVPPVTANVSNNIGLAPGSVSGAIGYRRELVGQRARVLRLVSGSFIGGLTGAVLLIVLPADAFETIVPVLIGLGIVLVVVQPRLSRRVAARREAAGELAGGRPDPWWIWPTTALAGVYGGYFGAAQGVILMGILGIGIDESLQRLNAVKNVLAAVVNGVAGVLFIFVADVDWWLVLLIAVGAVIGGQLGATVGRRLHPTVLRTVIVLVGLAALASFLL